MPHEPATADAPADLVLLGGTVLTLDAEDTRGAALAARGGEVVHVGDEARARDLIGADTTVIDLEGGAALPGINESHLHASWMGVMWPHTIMAAMTPGGGDRPAPAALTTSEQRREAILRAGEVAASLGITSYTEPGLGPGEDDGQTGACGADTLEQYRILAAQGRLRARVTVLALFGYIDGPSEIGDFEAGLAAVEQGDADPSWLRIGGVKIFADGIPPLHTAWITGRYADGTSGDLLVRGADTAERERHLRRMIRLAHDRGLQVGVHATGDRSIGVFLDEVAALGGAGESRHYVIHGDMATPEQLRTMLRLGMNVNVQPGLSAATAHMTGALPDDLVVAGRPLTEAMEAGLPLCLSSDAPVLSPDWRLGLAAAAETLGDRFGDARATMLRLLRCYTVHPAWQDRAESWKGTLEPGKAADVCVLDRDPLTVDPRDAADLRVDHTIVAGRVVFSRAEAAQPAN